MRNHFSCILILVSETFRTCEHLEQKPLACIQRLRLIWLERRTVVFLRFESDEKFEWMSYAVSRGHQKIFAIFVHSNGVCDFGREDGVWAGWSTGHALGLPAPGHGNLEHQLHWTEQTWWRHDDIADRWRMQRWRILDASSPTMSRHIRSRHR